MTTLALEACPACGTREASAIELGLRRCAACGTVYAPEYADPGEVFVPGYFGGGAGAFGVDTAHPRFQAFMAEVCARRLGLVERALPRGSRPPALLDVGCGGGELLRAALARGWLASGAEPMPEAADAARARAPEADVRGGLLADAGFPERAFDVVSAFHVLEHMPDARAFLRELARFARPGGLVVVESPNFASLLRRRQAERWVHLRPLEHLVHFTPGTMRAALEGAGLEPALVTTPTWLVRDHLLDEAAAELAQPRLRRALAPLSPRREVEGARVRVPSAPARAVLRAIEALYRRRGAGAVVLAAGRVA